MKGIVFNVLEEVVAAEYGEATWDLLLDRAAVAGVYTSLGNYPDEDLNRLAGAASEALNTPISDVVRWVGQRALPIFAERFPKFFAGHTSARTFVLTLNDIIHPEVRKVYPGAETPDFEFDFTRKDRLRMTYRSKRRLCAFAFGLIEGAANYYDEEVAIVETECMHLGSERCVFDLVFTSRLVAV